jgi:hypothetical protein
VHVAVLRREVARALLQRLDGPLVRVEVRDEGLVLRAEVHRVRGRPLASPVLLLDPPPLFRRHRNRGERGGARPSHSGASGRGCAALGARVPGLGGGGRKRVGEGKKKKCRPISDTSPVPLTAPQRVPLLRVARYVSCHPPSSATRARPSSSPLLSPAAEREEGGSITTATPSCSSPPPRAPGAAPSSPARRGS